ncbi:ABC transporter permease [Humibacter sp.]|uniref:branched-chain amino acid ABC transporter permease n=1 Tax=Humibacter sp. TaxID=1940291 RepID=UPI002C0E3211|nr:ABC transporter permease [Humibacter sp.]HVX09182.1 ABC transporter permease [Humibacter sp.]
MSIVLPLTIVGVVYGCVYAVTATGLVVTYATSGVFNFASGALGMMGAFTYWQLTVAWGLPQLAGLAIVLLVLAPLAGALIERVLIRRLDGSSLGVTLVVTVGLLLALIGVANLIWDPSKPRALPQFLPNDSVALPGVNISAQQLIIVGVSLSIAVVLRVFFTRTRVGAAMRGVVDDRRLLALAGVSPGRASQIAWAMGASLAALAGILLAPLVTLNILPLTLLVIDGYAAAVVGRLRSLPLTVVGGLALGLAESYSTGYLSGDLPDMLRPALPMFLLFLAVVFLRQDRLRAGRSLSGWAPRTVSRRRSLVAGAVFVIAATGASWVLPGSALPHFGQALALGFILLSLVLLTGYGGQVSLCQMTFVGFGAYLMGRIAPGGSVLGALVATACCAVLGALVAIPVLRLRGLYLALATLAFASGMDSIFFIHALGDGGIIKGARLRVGGLSFEGSHAYTSLLAAAFAAGAVVLLWVRRSRFGRRLAAMNDSPAACATLGVSINGTKLAVFSASAALAGFGGILYVGQTTIASANDFQMLNSLVLLLILTLGGAATVSGAFIGALVYAMFPVIQQHVPSLGQVSLLLTGLAAISVGQNPDGIVGQVAKRIESWRGSAASRPARVAGTAVAGSPPVPERDRVLA